MMKTNFQVNFLVKAIVSVDVKAETVEDAEKLARSKLDNGLFVKGIEYVDGQYVFIGYDDMDAWREVG